MSVRVKKMAGPRTVIVLIVARAGDTAVQIAGVDEATGAWVRLVGQAGEHALSLNALVLSDGSRARVLDTLRFAAITPQPRLPFVEDVVPDGQVSQVGEVGEVGEARPTRTGEIEERALSRTLSEIAVPHLDTLLPGGKRVLTTKDFQPGGRQRSVALLRPDELKHLHFSWQGDDVRVGVSFRHRSQAYGGQTGMECPDLKLRAFARDALKKAGTLSLTLDAKACYNRFACGRIYLTIGLIESAEGTFWPQVLGFHPIRNYAATIDYARL